MVQVYGINHVALDVDDLDKAIAFYKDILGVNVMKRTDKAAMLDLNGRFDFLALFEDPSINPDTPKVGHWGVVVDNLEAVRERAEKWNLTFYPDFECDFRDPFGYRVQVIRQTDVTKQPTPYDTKNKNSSEKGE
ncbi:VOC family protein [Nitrosomonas sp.]|uniref:VOC family protein n=1 Tax=Nitrosomonas sp. TaxID=42353 RepID=UPI001DBA0F3B|nr:VOC family protein [Nitrosomonas sp.]MCB1947846.1 VOC family protein [Nitrosomonas sp.]MCP5243121.1 VOC family protein [Burkholderiales bacterium]MDR4513857.1 VOC family protein [Nitrosomonas sp.]